MQLWNGANNIGQLFFQTDSFFFVFVSSVCVPDFTPVLSVLSFLSQTPFIGMRVTCENDKKKYIE